MVKEIQSLHKVYSSYPIFGVEFQSELQTENSDALSVDPEDEVDIIDDSR